MLCVITLSTVSRECLCVVGARHRLGVTMPNHGHNDCPHCSTTLGGSEATCPSCSGPLFGIAPRTPQPQEHQSEESHTSIEEVSVVTEVTSVVTEVTEEPTTDTGHSEIKIGDIAVPTYTPEGADQDAVRNDSVPDNFDSNPPNLGDFDQLMQEGETLGLSGDYSGARNSFSKATEVNSSNHMAWFNRGVMSEAIGDFNDAQNSFQMALEIEPEHGPSNANLAVLSSQLGNHSDAVKYAKMGLSSFPGHPALTELAGANETSPGSPQVVEIIETPNPDVDIIEENDFEMIVPLEEEPLQQEIAPIEDEPLEEQWPEPPGGIKELESTPQVTESVPEELVIDLDSLAENATQMIREGNPAEALESLRDHLPAAAVEHARCWRVAAGAMARLDLQDSAIEAFTYSLDLEPNDASCWFNLGALQRKSGDTQSSAESFAKALEINSQYPKAANGLALSCLENGDVQNSINAFRILMSLEPSHPSSIKFASLLIELAEGESDVLELDETLPATLPEGPAMAAEALKHLPLENTRENVELRARAHTLCGQHAESVTLWKTLLEFEKTDPNLWIGLSKSLIAAGSHDKATACRKKARDLGADIEVNETPPAPESEERVVEQVSEPSEIVDPWTSIEQEVETEAEQETVLTTQEIVAHESALDTISEPTPIVSQTSNPEVDLAAAALESQAAAMTEYQVTSDSSSVANQDIEWYNKGLELLTKDRYSEALSCFDRALPSFKDDNGMAIKILNGRGNCFYYMEQYKEAIESYFKAFGIDKSLTTGNALYNMGTAYAELESFENAIHCFNQSIGKEVGEPLKGENKKRCKEQIRRCKLLLKEKKKNS